MKNKNTTIDPFENLLNIVEKAKTDNNKKEIQKQEIIKEKEEILLPIIKFLVKVRDAGVMVYPFNYLFLSPTEKLHTQPVGFKFFQEVTTKDLKYDYIHPSPLLIITDPVKIEIGVVNSMYQKTQGLIKISCGNNHEDNLMLKGTYANIEDALTALSNFFGKNAVRIERS